jgi:muconolactone delta-isomerase
MKILALEKEIPGVPDDAFEPHLREEAARAWALHQAGVIRELYFRADRPEAVLVLECTGVEEARAALASLPLVRAGLIDFELVPLAPYPGFVRLFGSSS